MNFKRASYLLIFLLITLSLATLCLGDLPLKGLFTHLIQRVTGTSQSWNPILDERLPRLIVLITTGASLATAGAVMQALFANPLASPTSLGITSGGSLMVVATFCFGLSATYPFIIPISAFLGSILTLFWVYGLAMHRGHQLSSLLLIGLATSTFLSAIQGTLSYFVKDNWTIMLAIVEWEAGSSFDRSWQHVHLQLPLALTGIAGLLYYHREIDIMSQGEEEALALGVDVPRIRWRLFLLVSLLTGGALAAIGTLPFFGLLLPHLVRNWSGPKQLPLQLLCLLAGSTTLVFIDLILRELHIYNLTIGNLCALIGGLSFIILFFKKSRSGQVI